VKSGGWLYLDHSSEGRVEKYGNDRSPLGVDMGLQGLSVRPMGVN
jgi:hypothetical protein